MAATGWLESKLGPPPVRKGWLERPGLLDHLSGTTAKLVLVGAPPGFGKTSLVAQWCAAVADSWRCAWVLLDSDDNDPVRLWRHIIRGLQVACPGLDCREMRLPRTGADLAATLLPHLINELARLPAPVALVLDDYHVIKDRGCHEQIGFLLRNLPPSARLVLITRADPPLPLARLRVAGDMAEIRARELRFTPVEAAALVEANAAIVLSEADAADLTERAEGWPAGVYLASLALRDHPSPDAFIGQFSGSNRLVADFLAEEAVSRQPPEVQRFLRRTSILHRFTAPLCDAVVGVTNSAEIIAGLERDNLFVVGLDDHRQWYRYHHLFSQMLRSQLERAEPGLVRGLHERASAWYRERGPAGAAVDHALAARDITGAVELIARHWYAFAGAGRTATVQGWLAALDDDQIAGNPVAAHCAAWVAALSGNRASVRRWLKFIEAADEPQGPLPDGMRSLAFSAALLRGTFGFDGLQVMRESAAIAAGLEDDPLSPWYAVAQSALGACRYWSGDMTAAAEALNKALMSEAAAPLTRMLALAGAAVVAAEQDRLGQAGEFALAARRLMDATGLRDTPQGAVAWTAGAVVHAQQGRLSEAFGEFERALGSWRPWLAISPWPAVDMLLQSASVLLDLGDRAAAREVLTKVKPVLAVLPDGTQAFQARLDRLQRRCAGAWPEPPIAEPLTGREQAVLRLLRGTLSLRQIGQELDVSKNTIKTYTRDIYRKLGANTRDAAIEQARKLGILT